MDIIEVNREFWYNTTMIKIGDSNYRIKPRKLAYIKHDFSDRGGSFPNMDFFPDVITMNDRPNTQQKGRPIPARSNFWRYMEKTNDALGYKYARSIAKMWINIDYDIDTPYSTARAESIYCGGNFVSYDLETTTHIRLIAFPNNFDTSLLIPTIHNWRNMPYMFWKACSVEREGTKVQKVGEGLDVYIPFICNEAQFGLPAELWMEKRKVELLGLNQWSFKDGDVYLGGELFKATGVVK